VGPWKIPESEVFVENLAQTRISNNPQLQVNKEMNGVGLIKLCNSNLF
jgi:hypothetical protein